MRAETLHRNVAHSNPEHDLQAEPCAECVAAAASYPPAPPMRIERTDGLEFEVPTWDPAPTPWNATGSWVDDPELEARLTAQILEAIPGFQDLAREAARKPPRNVEDEPCRTYWGSHGCGLADGHDGLCVCTPDPADGPCSVGMKYGTGRTLITAWNGDDQPSPLFWTWFS